MIIFMSKVMRLDSIFANDDRSLREYQLPDVLEVDAPGMTS